MKKLIVLLIISFFGAGMVFAENLPEEAPPEEERTSMIGFSFGYTFAGFREETIADVNRYLNTFVFSIHSVIEKSKFMHSHNMGFFSGQNDYIVRNPSYQFERSMSDYYQIKDTYSRLYMEYSLARELWSPQISTQKFPGYIGGAIRTDMYLVETLDNPIYINLTAAISLNLHASQKWIINNKNSIIMSLSFPILGYAVRPQYIGLSAWPLETGITSLHNYLACFGSLRYYYKAHKFFSLYSDIGFEISNITFPKTRRDASLQLKIGAVYSY